MEVCRKKVGSKCLRRASEGTGRTGRDKVFAPMKRKEHLEGYPQDAL